MRLYMRRYVRLSFYVAMAAIYLCFAATAPSTVGFCVAATIVAGGLYVVAFLDN